MGVHMPKEQIIAKMYNKVSLAGQLLHKINDNYWYQIHKYYM